MWPFSNDTYTLLLQLSKKVDKVMATLQQIVDEVAAQTTTVAGLQSQINALPSLTPVQQAQIDAIFANVDANTKSVAAAMVANVPPAPPAPVPPVTP
jgi:ABC-type transporter Mla subunit MlaD